MNEAQHEVEGLKQEILLVPAMLVIGVLLTVGALIYETSFFLKSKRVVTTVVAVTSHNTEGCRSQRGLSHLFDGAKPCTRFNATLNYTVNGQMFDVDINAGYELRHDMPLSYAQYQKGQPLEVRYDKYAPSSVVVNTIRLLFLWTLVFGTTTLFMLGYYMYKKNQIRKIENRV